MATVYITSDKGKLFKYNKILKFSNGESIRTIFPYDVDNLVFIGNAEITKPAINLLLFHGIDTVFISKNGKYYGRLANRESKNIFLRKQQYELINDKDFCLEFSKAVVSSKIRNQITSMQRINRGTNSTKEAKEKISRLKQNLKNTENAETCEELRGIEGSAAREYFSIYKNSINVSWARFNGRTRNPPRDEVNSVLSFLYTLILHRVGAAIETKGLDPYAGYFHALDYGKTTLSFDLMEEYRVPLGDTLCSSLFNLKILEKGDFREVDFSPEDQDYPCEEEENTDVTAQETGKRGVLLTTKGMRKVIKQFEQKLEKEIYYKDLDKKLKYKDIFFAQADRCRRVINKREEKYKGLIIK